MQGNNEVYIMRGPFQGRHYFSLAEHVLDYICVRLKWRSISVVGRQWCFGVSRQRDAGLANSLVVPCSQLVPVVLNRATFKRCRMGDTRKRHAHMTTGADKQISETDTSSGEGIV